MGIGVQALTLMADLRQRGLLRPYRSIIEFGSQTFAPDSARARAALSELMPDLDTDAIETPRDLYRAIGFRRYVAIDLDQHDGALGYNLNLDLAAAYGFRDTFDMVTNHGTTEHAFDQMRCFENAHRLTAPGGMMLHALPSQGYQNHAFYSYHPSLFLDLAAANDYEVLGLWYNIGEELYAYTDGFLAENAVMATEFTAVFALLRKRAETDFVVPFDGRYYVEEKDGALVPRQDVGGHERVGENLFPVSARYPRLRRSGALATRPPRTRFILPVWGTAFIDAFLTFGLRAQIDNGSIDFAEEQDCEYVIVTDSDGAHMLGQSPIIGTLREKLRVTIMATSFQQRSDAYSKLTQCYNAALASAVAGDAYVFLTSDCFFSREVFARTLALLETKRLVLSPALRVVEESFITDIATSGAWNLSGPELLRLAMKHEHPLTEAFTLDNPRGVNHPLPAHMLVRLNSGYVGRWTVMHPIAMRIGNTLPRIAQTIDWNFGVMQIESWDDVGVLDSIADGLTVSTTPLAYDQGEHLHRGAEARHHLRNLKSWVDIPWALEFHLAQITHPVRLLIDGQATPDEVAAAEVRVSEVIGGLLAYVNSRRRVPRKTFHDLGAADLLRDALDFRRPQILSRRVLGKLLQRGKRGAANKARHFLRV
jgi:SAM-dependent methyltransferase